MSVKFLDFTGLISLIDFKAFVAAVLKILAKWSQSKVEKNRVRVFEAK